MSSSKKSPKKSPRSAGVKKPHRFRPGTVALREIRRQQRSTDSIFPFAAIKRLAKEIAQDFDEDIIFRDNAIRGIRAYIEDHLIGLYEDANISAIHAERKTVSPKDIQIARYIRRERR